MVQLRLIVLQLLLHLLCVSFDGVNGHITFIEAKYPLQGERSKPGTPWPLPLNYQTTDNVFSLDASTFQFESKAANQCDIIVEAIKRYKSLTFITNKKTSLDDSVPVLKKLNIQIDQPELCGWPQLNDDESYSIEVVQRDKLVLATLKSKLVWGMLRGLETFSQLVYSNDLNDTTRFFINHTHINDKPAYSYRGLMLDTSRHYLTLSTIIAHLDLMSFNKLNTLHLHIVDDQSWPLEMISHPELHTEGAYSPKHIYTQKQIKYIIDYARLLGIRILPELDSPGHTYQIPKRLLTQCYAKRTEEIINNHWTVQDILAQPMNRSDYGPPLTEYYGEHGKTEILNPMLNETYEYMLDLFKEFKKIFKDDYLHLGMDEVYYSCWRSNPDIIEWMKEMNMSSLHEIEQYYVERTLDNIKNKVKTKYQQWQDPLDNGVKVDKDAVIQVWKGREDEWREMARNVTSKGYQMVLSSPFYLNYITYQSPLNDWEKTYNVDISSFTEDPKQKDLVIGAEICVWSEYVDATNSISRTWPRASAPAERFWSNPKDYNIDSVRFRLDDMRCLMLKRGFNVQPILNGYCEWDLNISQ